MIRDNEGEELDIDFDAYKWRPRQQSEAFVIIVPRHLHHCPEVLEAKRKKSPGMKWTSKMARC